ncbi:hypothetical protein HK103_003928 [Boothiomyces macroporosus]|uniref:Uncharacterized protein n=1 Tax=Boothiomyces macroporosus TaxID=261099 RepID=A0AAD5UPC5_9FUNG|nr:hypothetical protein HK103_003928 [Boothiomyces macroporosus]KAJ3313096.1 hypothetical protein HDV04_002413 [Boothiomyces sp. JEL0838]
MEKDHKNNEAEMMNAFKVAANSVALLYKESLNQSKRSYNSGYEQAMSDVWGFIEKSNKQSVSAQELMAFIQSKHTEVTTTKNNFEHEIQVPHIPIFNPTLPENLPTPPVPFHQESNKRRWGAEQNSFGRLNDYYPEQKRNRFMDSDYN